MSEKIVQADPTPFLDGEGVKLIPRMPWLNSRRLALFLIFWLVLFFAGSILVENPFVGGSGGSDWWIGSTNYWWVVMYLHGLTVGMVGLGALVACDALEIPSLTVRRGILAGVLVAGLTSPLGAIFDRTPPWTDAGLWVQIVAFVALDEIAILLLWGIVELWRSGVPRTRTFPFIAAGLSAGAVLVAAVMGHLGGWILTFGDNPSIIGWYSSQQGEGVQDFANNLVLSHAYLMIASVLAGIVSLVAIRFGYYGLKGRTLTLARVGMALICLDVVLQVEMAILSGFSPWTITTPAFITSMNGLSWVGVNDLVTLTTLTFGGALVLIALLIGSGRLEGARFPIQVPVRATPFVMWISFAILISALEPPGGAGVGAPPIAWMRLYVGFFLSLMLLIVVLVVERLLPTLYQNRVGWTMLVGAALTFVGCMIYIYSALPAGGYVAVVGLVAVGGSFLATVWYGAVRPSPRASGHFLVAHRQR
ncbi:MAG: hypothetical protein HKL79_01295 [Thermoplasmata archaeon]|nr:hypothetical protein [Thermoplasmata archaeon]